MRYPVDYVRFAAREMRKVETGMRMGEGELSREQMQELLKATWKALDEIAEALEGMQRSGWRD
jgi:hypothetical protein